MKCIVTAVVLALFPVCAAQADCFEAAAFEGIGRVETKGGGTYVYGETVGGPAVMRGYLQGRPAKLAEAQFDLDQGYHIGFADAGLAARLAPKAAAAEPKGSVLRVSFWALRNLPAAVPGKGWSGKIEAEISAQPPGEPNQHAIGHAKLTGVYSFLPEMQAEIGGCSYRIQPVELQLADQGEAVLQRRILSFPDLGVSAITRWGPDADGPKRTTGVLGFGYGSDG